MGNVTKGLFKQVIFVFIVSVLLLMCLFSCKKHNPDPEVRPAGEAKIRLINAAPNSPSLDFQIDRNKINPNPLVFGEQTDYIKINAGAKEVAFVHENEDKALGSFNYVSTLSYTSFYTEDRNGIGEVLTLEDDLGAVPAGKVKVRFVNTSPYFSANANVFLDSEELLYGGLAYKNISSSFLINEGLDLRVSVAGTIRTISADELQTGKIYVFWISGSANSNWMLNKISYN